MTRRSKTTAPESGAAPDEAAPEGSFEATLGQLADIVAELEAGELPLERSLELFERGMKLAKASQERLDAVEQRVELLLSVDEEGRPVVKDLGGS
jgi:exodeoxyribonuclease VII small subunit